MSTQSHNNTIMETNINRLMSMSDISEVVHRFPNGDEYTGTWDADGKIDGKGKYKWKRNGREYTGEFRHGKLSGQGQLVFSDTTTYCGHFEDGKMNGPGRIRYKLGQVFEGQFKNGNIVGPGLLKFNRGGWYKGTFRGHRMHGQGELKYAHGNVYCGEFSNGRRHGEGETLYANGKAFVGHYHQDRKHGLGESLYRNGSIYCGEFTNGKKGGYGEVISADGASFIGEYNGDKRHGKGIVRHVNGLLFYEIRRNGRLQSSLPFDIKNPIHLETLKELAQKTRKARQLSLRPWSRHINHYWKYREYQEVLRTVLLCGERMRRRSTGPRPIPSEIWEMILAFFFDYNSGTLFLRPCQSIPDAFNL
eukprot:m.27141 g.27141  ORF g.27141 m.27141 type:complete len:362 (+) comp7866_c0_seq2:354-1439(+)